MHDPLLFTALLYDISVITSIVHKQTEAQRGSVMSQP